MTEMKQKHNPLSSVFTALFAALIAVAGFISIPVPGSVVPIVLQNMMPVLAGSLLGGIQGAGATGLFLVAGALGLPVFSGGSGGIAHVLGPTGGFLIGYFFSSLAAGLFIGRANIEEKTPFAKIAIGALLGFILMYIPGILQFMNITEMTLQESLALCVIPFLPGDAIKLILTVILSVKLRPVIARYLSVK